VVISFVLLLIIGSLPANNARTDDFSNLTKDFNIKWNITPNSLFGKWNPNQFVLWFGEGLDYKIFNDKENKTNILWAFNCHRFEKPSPSAVIEPFNIIKKNAGIFVLHLIIPTLSKIEAEQFIRNHKKPYHILIAGKPKAIINFKGNKAILIQSDNWDVRDYFKINYIFDDESSKATNFSK